MERSWVMTVIGDDRPGLVEALARTISEHGGNWLESRMAHLGGKFAGILRVSVAEERSAAMLETVQGLEDQGLRVVWEEDTAPARRGRPVKLELVGADHTGIVRDIAALLREHQVNVEELVTHRQTAPMSGQMLFHATALLHLPAGMSQQDLRVDLEDLAHDLMVEVDLLDPEPE